MRAACEGERWWWCVNGVAAASRKGEASKEGEGRGEHIRTLDSRETHA